MASEPPGSSLTELLQRYGSGDRGDADALFREIWPTLHELAVRQLSHERAVAPVSPTELISELWLRNLNRGGWKIANREHFYAIVSIAMRRVLVDLARQRLAAVRGSGQLPTSLEESHAADLTAVNKLEEVVQLGLFMERTEKKNRLGCLVADMHYFAGYSFQEIAQATGLTTRQVSYLWEKIEKQLKKQLR